MATLSPAECDAAGDTLMRMSGEDAAVAGRIVAYLDAAFPGFDWLAILRARSLAWAPFAVSGLTTAAWCDEVARMAAVYGAP